MSSGHAAVEVLTTPPAQFVALNEARYKDLKLNGAQTNEILAQVGALVRSGSLVGGSVRKMVLGGTSMTAGVLINYLPAHMVYRTRRCSEFTTASCRCRTARWSATSTCRDSRARRCTR